MNLQQALQKCKENGHAMVLKSGVDGIEMHSCSKHGCDAVLMVDKFTEKSYFTGSALSYPCYNENWFRTLLNGWLVTEYALKQSRKRDKSKLRLREQKIGKEIQKKIKTELQPILLNISDLFFKYDNKFKTNHKSPHYGGRNVEAL